MEKLDKDIKKINKELCNVSEYLERSFEALNDLFATYSRDKKDNSEIFVKENIQIAEQYFQDDMLKELYTVYLDWGAKHKVGCLVFDEFETKIRKLAPQYFIIKQKPKQEEQKLDIPQKLIVLSKIMGFVAGCIDKGCTLTETENRAREYCLQILPQATENLVFHFGNFARAMQNFDYAKSDLLRQFDEESPNYEEK